MQKIFRFAFCGLVGVVTGLALATKTLAAERVHLIYGPLNFSVSVRSLEQYAQNGTVSKELEFYTQRIKPAQLAQLRSMLQRHYIMNAVAVDRLFQSSIVEDLFRNLGETILAAPETNGFYAMRSAILAASAQPNGWTVVDVVHHFPTDVWIDIQKAMNWMNASQSSTPTASTKILDSNSCQANQLFY